MNPGEENLLNITRRNINDEVYEILKDKIAERLFFPGQRLDLVKIENQMGISRTPLKDALNRLAAEGVVEIRPRKGTYVSNPSIVKISETFDIRTVLELHAVSIITPELQPDQLDQMRNVFRQMIALTGGRVSTQRYQEYVALDHAMHRLIIEFTRNSSLLEIWEQVSMHTLLAQCHYLGNKDELDTDINEHQSVLNAFEAGDTPGVKEALEDHIQRAKTLLLKQMEGANNPIRDV